MLTVALSVGVCVRLVCALLSRDELYFLTIVESVEGFCLFVRL